MKQQEESVKPKEETPSGKRRLTHEEEMKVMQQHPYIQSSIRKALMNGSQDSIEQIAQRMMEYVRAMGF